MIHDKSHPQTSQSRAREAANSPMLAAAIVEAGRAAMFFIHLWTAKRSFLENDAH
jgi:hypothetical protein